MKLRNPRIDYSTEVSLRYKNLSLCEMTEILRIYQNVLSKYSTIYVEVTEITEYESLIHTGTWELRFFRHRNGIDRYDKLINTTNEQFDELELLRTIISENLKIK